MFVFGAASLSSYIVLFVALGTFSSSPGIFRFLVPFTSSHLKTDLSAKTLINRGAMDDKRFVSSPKSICIGARVYISKGGISDQQARWERG